MLNGPIPLYSVYKRHRRGRVFMRSSALLVAPVPLPQFTITFVFICICIPNVTSLSNLRKLMKQAVLAEYCRTRPLAVITLIDKVKKKLYIRVKIKKAVRANSWFSLNRFLVHKCDV